MTSNTTSTSSRSKKTTSPDTSDNLALTKSILGIKKQQDSFEKSVTELKKIIEEQLGDLELKTNAKRKQMDELDEEFELRKKSRKIELDQDLKAYGYSEAIKLIQDKKEVTIALDDLNKLKSELDLHKRDHSQQLADVSKIEREKYERELQIFKTTSDLQHKTEVAKMTSQVQQLQDHIKVLDKQIQSLQQDVEKQRELTRDVANASKPQYYQSVPSGRQ
jgi:hypothetical protein